MFDIDTNREFRKQDRLRRGLIYEHLYQLERSNSHKLIERPYGLKSRCNCICCFGTNTISDNVRRAFEQKRRKGEVTGRCVLGYINDTDFTGNKTLRLDPERAHLIVQMFELYSTGLHSIESIQQKITDLGLKTRSGKALTKSTVERVLSETFYYGVAYSKRYDSYHPHKYDKLISKELFDKCQEAKIKRKKQPNKVISN